jgi:hypothetical protein
MDIRVSRLPLGQYDKPTVSAWCNSQDCAGLAPGAKIITLCHANARPPFDCATPAPLTDDNLHTVERWLAEEQRH